MAAARSEKIDKAVRTIAQIFGDSDTAPPVLVSAATSLHRLLARGSERGLDVNALVAGVSRAGVPRQLLEVLLHGGPSVELWAAVVLALHELLEHDTGGSIRASIGAAAVNLVAAKVDGARQAVASAEAQVAAEAQVGQHVLKYGKVSPQLRQRLDALMAGTSEVAPVVLFMKGDPDAPRCGFSKSAVVLLREHCVAFQSFDVLSDAEVRSASIAFGWQRLVRHLGLILSGLVALLTQMLPFQ
jgi:hypothetical protein